MLLKLCQTSLRPHRTHAYPRNDTPFASLEGVFDACLVTCGHLCALLGTVVSFFFFDFFFPPPDLEDQVTDKSGKIELEHDDDIQNELYHDEFCTPTRNVRAY